MQIPYNVMVVNFSEIDPKAIEVYCAIHGIDKTKNLGDITQINPFELELINFLFGGSPCQSFSTAGKLDGSNGLVMSVVMLLTHWNLKTLMNLSVLTANPRISREVNLHSLFIG